MKNEVKERLVMVLEKNGYDVIHRTTYGELKKKYPRFVEISNKVQERMEGREANDNDMAIVTPVSLEYIHGINNAKTKNEMEIYFELMYHEAREQAVIMVREENPTVTEEVLDRAREEYSKILESVIRPSVSKIIDQFVS